jgi:phosphoglycolate phosphatase-like HAD superfamily hydrolase
VFKRFIFKTSPNNAGFGLSKIREYLSLRTGHSSLYIRFSSLDLLSDVGGVIFDCDGVLIDEKTSYDVAIRDVVSYIASQLTGLRLAPQMVPVETIYAVRRVGSFNNDCDTVYILVEWFLHKAAEELGVDLGERFGVIKSSTVEEFAATVSNYAGFRDVDEGRVVEIFRGLEKFVAPLTATAMSLEEVEKSLGFNGEFSRLLKALLKYPGVFGESILATVFDEAFFGSDTITQVRGRGPFFNFEGSLKHEKPIVVRETLEALKELGLRMGMSTGRGSWETWKTLSDFSDYFNRDACIFISDIVNREPGLRQEVEKPSPWSLRLAAEKLSAEGNIAYIGNSAEDFLMWKRARETDPRMLFVGVFGDSEDLADFFIENGVDAAIPTVNQLPKVFEAVKS